MSWVLSSLLSSLAQWAESSHGWNRVQARLTSSLWVSPTLGAFHVADLTGGIMLLFPPGLGYNEEQIHKLDK